ncbi:unnamed protein product [Didymodactylos carnosus]|uniref:EF-hand domain-containing protein n=1 Tax=Didymodactylos carnosus TaxID=1234261 RepID=A0A814TPX1_9BILA|nr:unnamed protein product [Didymodactylos carnosus]CAF1165241.1 unnamed protein product [Didymodactylos carnosus]CAF3882697.1 unnamed protein product [Didymodactylos carnosus]CAF3928875.1 unnamed protein product [Didymodactylos carnosus]
MSYKQTTPLAPRLFAFGGSTKPVSELIFKKYDLDENGSIELEELRNLCYDMGCYLSDKDLIWARTFLDKDGDGRISYPEFAAWWKTSNRFHYLKLDSKQMNIIHKICEIYRSYDQQNKGILDKTKFQSLKTDLLKHNILKENQPFNFDEIDRSHDGKINFNELIAWFVDIGLLTMFDEK